MPSREPPQWAVVMFTIIVFPIFFPIMLTSWYRDYREAEAYRKALGNPPRRQPGQRFKDYIHRYIHLPRQRRRHGQLQSHSRITQTNTALLNLPVELLDLVMLHLNSDRETLKDCSLVSRTWVSPARYHLFNKIQPIRHDAYTLWALLDSPYRTIPAVIQEVTMEDTAWWTTVNALLRQLASTRTTTQALNLQLYNPFRHHSSLTSLGVVKLNVVFDGTSLLPFQKKTDSALHAILSSFPDLQSLSMKFFVHPFVDLAGLPTPPRTLRHLGLDSDEAISTGHAVEKIFQWFTRGEHKLQLETLSYIVKSESSRPFTDYLGGDAATMLQVLEVAGQDGDPEKPFPPLLDVYFPLNEQSLILTLRTLQIRVLLPVAPANLLIALKRLIPRCPNLTCLAFRYASIHWSERMARPSHEDIMAIFGASDISMGSRVDMLGQTLHDAVLLIYRRRL